MTALCSIANRFASSALNGVYLSQHPVQLFTGETAPRLKRGRVSAEDVNVFINIDINIFIYI